MDEYRLGLDPSRSDTDGDGLPDGWEVAFDLNPRQNDASLDIDGDGLTNLDEYQHGTNPTVADTDADGMPDGWEVTYGLNPTNSSDASMDLDSDGVSNVREFWFGTDPTNPDTDGDGYDDGVEVRYGTNPLDSSDYPISTVTTIIETSIVTETSSIIGTETETTFIMRTVLGDVPVIISSLVAMLAIISLVIALRRRSSFLE